MTTRTHRDADRSQARRGLIRVLQAAHAGEGAAQRAYAGHAASLRDPTERAEVEQIRADELDHLARVAGHLQALEAGPARRREIVFSTIGTLISWFCRVGGWYAPMWGAGALERHNVGEYEDAARLAHAAGVEGMCDDLLDMAEVEWDHDAYFRSKVRTHWLRHLLREWPEIPPRASIRARFDAYVSGVPEVLAASAA